VIASHYAEPVERKIAAKTELRSAPSEDGDTLLELEAGEPFWMLDDSVGWAWGYAGKDRRVGYVTSASLGTA
jgi:hypothetical protein